MIRMLKIGYFSRKTGLKGPSQKPQAQEPLILYSEGFFQGQMYQ